MMRKRQIFMGIAVVLLVLMGVSTAFASHHATMTDNHEIYQRSPDCKYPPCD